MANRLTPHLGIAAGIVALGLILCLPPILTGGGSHPVVQTVPKVTTPAAAVLPADSAAAPMVAAYDLIPDTDPFSGRTATRAKNGPRIPLPPPPPLDPPGPPLLPLPEVR